MWPASLRGHRGRVPCLQGTSFRGHCRRRTVSFLPYNKVVRNIGIIAKLSQNIHFYYIRLAIKREIDGEQREDEETREISSHLTMGTAVANHRVRGQFLCVVGGK